MATIATPTITTIYPFQSESIPNLTNYLLISVGTYMYLLTYIPVLITSPTAILNSPINLFCPLDTALVLISGNFFSIFPPSPPLLHEQPMKCQQVHYHGTKVMNCFVKNFMT